MEAYDHDSRNKGSYPSLTLILIEFHELQKARKSQIQRWDISIQIEAIAARTISLLSFRAVIYFFSQV